MFMSSGHVICSCHRVVTCHQVMTCHHVITCHEVVTCRQVMIHQNAPKWCVSNGFLFRSEENLHRAAFPRSCAVDTHGFLKNPGWSTVQERGGATRRQFSSFLNKNPIRIHTNSSVMACHPVTTWHPIIASHPLMACHRCTPTRTATEERNNHSIILPAAEFPRPTPPPSHFGRTRNDTKTNAFNLSKCYVFQHTRCLKSF